MNQFLIWIMNSRKLPKCILFLFGNFSSIVLSIFQILFSHILLILLTRFVNNLLIVFINFIWFLLILLSCLNSIFVFYSILIVVLIIFRYRYYIYFAISILYSSASIRTTLKFLLVNFFVTFYILLLFRITNNFMITLIKSLLIQSCDLIFRCLYLLLWLRMLLLGHVARWDILWISLFRLLRLIIFLRVLIGAIFLSSIAFRQVIVLRLNLWVISLDIWLLRLKFGGSSDSTWFVVVFAFSIAHELRIK